MKYKIEEKKSGWIIFKKNWFWWEPLITFRGKEPYPFRTFDRAFEKLSLVENLEGKKIKLKIVTLKNIVPK